MESAHRHYIAGYVERLRTTSERYEGNFGGENAVSIATAGLEEDQNRGSCLHSSQ